MELQGSVQEFASGDAGQVTVSTHAQSDNTSLPYDNHFRPDEDLDPGPAVDETFDKDDGVFADTASAVAIESTYDFAIIQAGGGEADGSINIFLANPPLPTGTRSNVVNLLGSTEILGTGHIDVSINGFVELIEQSGDMRLGSITSNADFVKLTSPAAIVDTPSDSRRRRRQHRRRHRREHHADRSKRHR